MTELLKYHCNYAVKIINTPLEDKSFESPNVTI